jgi:putative nucleotidyltransferase with HDIG domain
MKAFTLTNLRSRGWGGPLLNASVLVLVSTLLVTLVALPFPVGQVQLASGEVSTQDIVAPHRLTYESAIRTQNARDRASQAVPDYYDPPQSRIRRLQVSRSHEVLETIAQIRAERTLSLEQQIEAVLSISDLNLISTLAEEILALSPAEWDEAVSEVPIVLDQIMREDIKENSLSSVRRRIPVLVSPDLSEEVSSVVVELVRALVRPNSFLNPERTQELRQQAWDSVPIQTLTLEQGEMILRAGDIVTPLDVEALEHLGLNQVEWSWWRVMQVLLMTSILITLVVGAVYRLQPQILTNRRQSALLLLLSTIGLLTARFMIVPHDWLPYLFPLAALSMLAALLLNIQAAMAMVLSFALFVAYLSSGNVLLIFYSIAGALLSALVVGKAERLTSFLWAGLVIILANTVVVISLWTQPFDMISSTQWLRMLLMILINGILSTSIALIGYFTLGNLFGITTTLQLMELSRPTHPLLRQLLLKAPGTYHHTILVSNLAERAAEAIGADAFLIRVGAYYHDIGKTVRPYFFTENIGDDSSPHAGLDAKTSAQIIISHVKDGADLARKYHLPPVIQDFIWQHHGAQVMSYFYQKALTESRNGAEINIDDFRYPGPSPQSKEAGIMLLADVCEAAVRTERPATRQDLESMIDQLITQRVLDGSLDASNLTFHEVHTIRRIFAQVLQGVHHPRIKYPMQSKTYQDEKAEIATKIATQDVAAGEPSLEEMHLATNLRWHQGYREPIASTSPVQQKLER